MKKIWMLLALGLFLSGCASTASCFDYVYQEQSNVATIHPDSNHAYIRFNADKLPQTDIRWSR